MEIVQGGGDEIYTDYGFPETKERSREEQKRMPIMPIEDTPIKSSTPVTSKPLIQPFEQRTIEIYKKGQIPPSLFNKMASVLYPPTKWSRFTFSEKEMNDQLTAKIKSVLPQSSIIYQPHKAEVPDMVISTHEGIVCKINFIHMDKPDSPGCIQMKKLKPELTTCKAVQGVTSFFKSGEKQTQDRDSSKCFLHLIVFYHREKKEEYEKVKQVVEDFFRNTEKVVPIVERERPMIQRGGKRKSRSTQKRSSLHHNQQKQKQQKQQKGKKLTRRLRKRNMF